MPFYPVDLHPMCGQALALWRDSKLPEDTFVYICNMVNSTYLTWAQALIGA